MLRGATLHARFPRKCLAPLAPILPNNHLAGIRCAFTRPRPPSAPSGDERTGPLKPGIRPGSKPGAGSSLSSGVNPGMKPSAGPTGQSSRRKSNEPPKKPRDERIPFNRVRLVDSETGALGPLTLLSEVIAAVRSRVGPSSDEQPTESDEDHNVKWWKKRRYCVELVVDKPTPIVKVVDLGGEYHRNKEAAKKKKEGAVKEKEVQMTWSVAQGDLEHKLKKAREALDEGERVTIGFARKKGQGYPQPEDMAAKLQETAAALEDVAEQWKERAILPNHTGFLYLKKRP